MNKAIITGRLAADPKPFQSTTGEKFCTFCVASFYNKEHTDFINCIAFGKTADFILEYTKKAHLVAIEGRLQCRNYTDSFGQKKYIYEIVVSNVDLLTSKTEADELAQKEAAKAQASADFDQTVADVANDPEMPWNK